MAKTKTTATTHWSCSTGHHIRNHFTFKTPLEDYN